MTGEQLEIELRQDELEAAADEGYVCGYLDALRAALLIADVGMRFIPHNATKARKKELTERNHAVRDIKQFLDHHAKSREGYTADEIRQIDDVRFPGFRGEAKSSPD